MLYNFNIKNFNLNVEVGGRADFCFSKSVTLRTLVAFFEFAIPDPWSPFSVALYNEVTGYLAKCIENAPKGADIRLARETAYIS
jgi:hypothetical protein